MQALKQLVKKSISSAVRVLGAMQVGRYVLNEIAAASMEQTAAVSHRSQKYFVAIPNEICRFRADTFSSKEPETLEWIDGFEEGCVFWDVGANVGLYSLYAASARRCRVWAFEPSVFNLECLARNSFINGVTDRVCIVPLAVNDRSGPNALNMTSTCWGGALSTFGKDYGHDGKQLASVFRYTTLGISMDDAMDLMRIPQPDYLKIDVDGIEHLILKGGARVLRSLKGALVEVNDGFHEQASECTRILEGAGLVLRARMHSDIAESSEEFRHTYNQIWARPS